jgi:hypothetical protein
VVSTPCLLYTILCVVFEAKVINLCDRDIATDHHVLTSIDLVYVRIPGKGITLHRLLQEDDDNSEIGIGSVLSGNNHGWFYEILNGG